MSNTEPTLGETRAREVLQGERERIESSLADLKQLVEGELDQIDTDTDLLDDGELIEEEQIDDALAAQLHGELEAVERAERPAYGRHLRLLDPKRRADPGEAP